MPVEPGARPPDTATRRSCPARAGGRRSARATRSTPATQRGSADSIPSTSSRPSRPRRSRQRRIERGAVEPGAAAAPRPPLLGRAEVVHEPERDVGHRLPVGDRDRQGVMGDPALGVQRAVDRIDDHAHVVVAVVDLAALLGARPRTGSPPRGARRAGRARAARRRGRSRACGRRPGRACRSRAPAPRWSGRRPACAPARPPRGGRRPANLRRGPSEWRSSSTLCCQTWGSP